MEPWEKHHRAWIGTMGEVKSIINGLSIVKNDLYFFFVEADYNEAIIHLPLEKEDDN